MKNTQWFARNRTRWNNRGAEMLVDFFAILLFAIVILVFYFIILANKQSITEKVNVQFANKDAQYMLTSFLRAPSLLDRDKTIGQTISENAITGDFTDTKALFNYYFDGVDMYGEQEILFYDIQIMQGTTVIAPLYKPVHLYELTATQGGVGIKLGTSISAENTRRATATIPLQNGGVITLKMAIALN